MAALKVPEIPETPETGNAHQPEIPAAPIGGGKNGKTGTGTGEGAEKAGNGTTKATRRKAKPARKGRADPAPQKAAQGPASGAGGLRGPEQPEGAAKPGKGVEPASRKGDEFRAPKGQERLALPHDMPVMPSVMNAVAMERWLVPVFGEVNVTELAKSLQDANRAMRDDDMTRAHSMLHAQAMTLQTIFTNLARLAAPNMTRNPAAGEALLRMALRAQAQSCKTLETLHEMKNPRPVTFVRQAAIAHGPQQVNVHPAPVESTTPRPELLEETHDGITRLDTRAPQAAVRADTDVAPLGSLDRPPQP
jgi:hypothetical protein